MYQWGDPHADDSDKMKVGDRVKVKRSALPRPGQAGTLTAITDYGFTVQFSDGQTVTYDGDDLLLVNK
jgi:hypothetical protein